MTPATAKCMARFNPASANVHNCPKPPPGASTAQHPTPPVNEAASPDAVQLKYGALKP